MPSFRQRANQKEYDTEKEALREAELLKASFKNRIFIVVVV